MLGGPTNFEAALRGVVGLYNEKMITVTAQEGLEPRFERVLKGEIGADSQERKETKTKEDSKVDEAPSATQREQPLEARATNHSVEAASEGQYNTAPPADSTWLISPKSLLLVLAAVSLLAVAWFIGR
jgi:hypothetical protein